MNQAPQKQKNIKEFLLAKENRLGLFVLCIGAVALIWVLFSAFQKFTGPVDPSEYYAQQQIESEPPEYVQEVKPKKPKYKVQEDITAQEIAGAWDGQAVGGRMLLQLSNGNYKFAYVNKNGLKSNIYSMGTYTQRGALLMFQPSRNFQAGAKEFPGYQNLTRSPFPVSVTRKGSRLILQKPGDNLNIYVPPFHPFLKLMPDEVAVFEPLK